MGPATVVNPGVCPICGGQDLADIGSITGKLQRRPFTLRRCRTCWFAFVSDPWTEFDAIYTEAYYHGRGADPWVDYVFELEHPEQTVRRYEWHGIIDVVSRLTSLGPATQWLDFGCGNGGLVRWARDRGINGAVGHETGWIADRAMAAGIPILSADQLDDVDAQFDLITAIEVLEHLPDPVAVLAKFRRWLKPGGIVFITTGNARPYRTRLTEWAYVVPEIHVSFFEPGTLATAMARAGLDTTWPGFLPGFENIVRFKMLKTMKVHRVGLVERAVPWSLVSRIVDARFQVSAFPVGVRPANRP